MSRSALTWLEVNRHALTANLRGFYRSTQPHVPVMAVVKGNAYGHGMYEVASVLRREQHVWGFAVASLQEALELRGNKVRNKILVLSYAQKDLYADAAANNIQLACYSIRDATYLNKVAKRVGKQALVHIKVDVGTSRVGVIPNSTLSFARALHSLSHIRVVGVFAHLADSENSDATFTHQQYTAFYSVLHDLAEQKLLPREAHVACTAAGLRFSTDHQTVARLGIGLYGFWPSRAAERYGRKKGSVFAPHPVLTWKTTILQVKTISRGTTVGYDRTWTARRTTKIAVLPVGYWDGYDRGFSNRGVVLVGGKRCPVVGRVCMNLTMVDVTHVPSARAGSIAVLLGRQGTEELRAEELAAKLNTIHYEVVTRLHPSIPRKVV